MIRIILIGLLSFNATASALWTPVSNKDTNKSQSASSPYIAGKQFSLDLARLKSDLATDAAQQTIILPSPEGNMVSFKLVPNTVMPKDLQARYPEIRTYTGYSETASDKPAAITISPYGVNAMYSRNKDWVHVVAEKKADKNSNYVAYYSKQAPRPINFQSISDVITPESQPLTSDVLALDIPTATGNTINYYRLALTSTGEFSRTQGGTKEGVMTEYANLVNRMNQVFLSDLAIQFQLVSDTDKLIFLDPSTDPFTNNDKLTDINTNQITTDDEIGNDEYDIGHLLGTSAGGVARLWSLCSSGNKAHAYSSLQPDLGAGGDAFYFRVVMHEIGHQLGANHTFNGVTSGSCSEGNHNPSTGYEPGGGSTIMAYAGLCSGQDLQDNSDPLYHASSITEMRAHINIVSGGTCGVPSADIVNPLTPTTPPVVSVAQSNYVIPANTPFSLTATATDTDNDELTYIWEQINAGGELGKTSGFLDMNQDNGHNPLFRSFTPVVEPTRYFPKLENVLNNTSENGEVIPTTTRELDFRVTVRDNNGGVNADDINVSVVNTGEAFSLSQPSCGDIWVGNETVDISWNTGDSELSPISCSNVDILLDTSSENSFSTTIASGIINNGQASVTIPSVDSDQSRLMIKCSDNVFYAVNPSAFKVRAQLNAPVINGQQAISFDEDSTYEVTFADLEITDFDDDFANPFVSTSISQCSDTYSLTLVEGDNYTLNGNTVIPAPDYFGNLSVPVVVNDGRSDSNEFNLTLTVAPINEAPVIDSQNTVIMYEDIEYQVKLQDLNVSDIDNNYPEDFTIQIATGFNYTATGDLVTPNANYNGSLRIRLRVFDGEDYSSLFSLTTNVTAINDDPVAQPDTLIVQQGSNNNVLALLSNDSDVDGDSIRVSSFNYSGLGNINLTDGQLSYSPSPSFSGTETFTYEISDGNGGTSSALVTLQVQPDPNQSPANNENTDNDSSGGDSGGGTMLWLLSLVFIVLYRAQVRAFQ